MSDKHPELGPEEDFSWLEEDEREWAKRRALELRLIRACEEYWEYRRKLYGEGATPRGAGIEAKMKMYKAMADLWEDIPDGYGDYS